MLDIKLFCNTDPSGILAATTLRPASKTNRSEFDYKLILRIKPIIHAVTRLTSADFVLKM